MAKIELTEVKLRLTKKRFTVSGAIDVDTLTYPDAVAAVAKALGWHEETQEVVHVLCVNNGLRVTGFREIARGKVDSADFAARDIFQTMFLTNASGFFMVHNHPSGSARPSTQDIEVTKRLAECAELMGVKFYDHIIVLPNGDHLSMVEEGYAQL